MKMNRRLLCLLLSVCLILWLCACATQEKITVPKESETAATTETPITSDEKAPDSAESTIPSDDETDAPSEPTDPSVYADSDLAQQLIGTWQWDIDISKALVDGLSTSMGVDLSERADELEMVFSFTFEFAQDGTCKGYFDEETLSSSFTIFIDSLCGILTDVTYEMLEEQGVGREEADANFESQYGCGILEYYDELMSASLNLDTVFGQLPAVDSTYKLEGDQLTVAYDGAYHDDAVTISIDGDVMTLDGFIDPSIEETFTSLGMSLPFVMNRK